MYILEPDETLVIMYNEFIFSWTSKAPFWAADEWIGYSCLNKLRNAILRHSHKRKTNCMLLKLCVKLIISECGKYNFRLKTYLNLHLNL